MPAPIQHVEPLFAYVSRKYFEPSLAILPLVAAAVVDVTLLRVTAPPPLWALVYPNILGLVMSASLLIAYRSRFERRRFRIREDSIALPSVVRIDGSSIELLAVSSVAWVRGVRREIGILGWHMQALAEVEIKTRYGGKEVVLVWPVEAFGRRNLDVLLRALSAVASIA